MPDNWSYVVAAYGLTALVLGLYWRHLVRKENELAGHLTAHTDRVDESSPLDHRIVERSQESSRPAHPRPDPTTRGPLQQ